MKAIFDKQKGKWRIIVPPSQTGTGKRCRLFFESKDLAEAKAQRIRIEGTLKKLNITENDLALLEIIKTKYAGDAKTAFVALSEHDRIVGWAIKKATLHEASKAFIAHQEHEKRNRRTIYKYNSTLNRLCQALNYEMPMVELTEHKINELYLKPFGPGTTRRAQYANVHAFVNWAFQNGYLGVDPMARMKPADKWTCNNDHLEIEDFRRLLFTAAGLEPIEEGGEVTLEFRRLLPFFVLGGLAGMRRCELIDSDPRRPTINWTDIKWKRNLIHIRSEVAKQTGSTDQSRWISLEPAAAEWLHPMAKVEGQIMNISQSTFQRDKANLLDALGFELPDNSLRNSYASFAASIRNAGEVAAAMGDNESTMKRFYMKRLEPGSGNAWFDIRPSMSPKIVRMQVA